MSGPRSMDDSPESLAASSADEIIARIAAHDTAALGEFVRRYQQDVLRLAYRLLGNWPDAEDVAQDVFLRVWRGAERYRGGTNIRAWLYRIVVNLVLDESRKRRVRSAEALGDTGVTVPPSQSIEEAETMHDVRRAVGRLPDRQRTVLVLRRYHGLALKDIAEVTGWTPSAVESLMTRALSNLRRELGESQEKSSAGPQGGSRSHVE